MTESYLVKVKNSSHSLNGKVGVLIKAYDHLTAYIRIDEVLYLLGKDLLESYIPQFRKGDRVKVLIAPHGDDGHCPVGDVFAIDDIVVLASGWGAYADSKHHRYALLKNLMLMEDEPGVPAPITRPGYCVSCNFAKAVFGVVCEPCFQRHRNEHRDQMWGNP